MHFHATEATSAPEPCLPASLLPDLRLHALCTFRAPLGLVSISPMELLLRHRGVGFKGVMHPLSCEIPVTLPPSVCIHALCGKFCARDRGNPLASALMLCSEGWW
eukprot:TRINITY_DN75604_c0_g1_i1.p4 TRINITY_DN75604_c0_g1~~TRINITY_DN75604_c0_g1_i1.p4  ORF type:complete len:105 (+),score=12.27 TRINITY_DN75604_c0_g1_i1:311-625(+)